MELVYEEEVTSDRQFVFAPSCTQCQELLNHLSRAAVCANELYACKAYADFTVDKNSLLN